jgi:hypothetical protein
MPDVHYYVVVKSCERVKRIIASALASAYLGVDVIESSASLKKWPKIVAPFSDDLYHLFLCGRNVALIGPVDLEAIKPECEQAGAASTEQLNVYGPTGEIRKQTFANWLGEVGTGDPILEIIYDAADVYDFAGEVTMSQIEPKLKLHKYVVSTGKLSISEYFNPAFNELAYPTPATTKLMFPNQRQAPADAFCANCGCVPRIVGFSVNRYIYCAEHVKKPIKKDECFYFATDNTVEQILSGTVSNKKKYIAALAQRCIKVTESGIYIIGAENAQQYCVIRRTIMHSIVELPNGKDGIPLPILLVE